MTPQERQLMSQLFDRLATLESAPRDPDAEAMIREGFRRAPNAAYALVQTVLLQDEALKAANAHIQQYEQSTGTPQQANEPPRSFLDNMRDSVFGREEPRGSVPRVPQVGARRWARRRRIRGGGAVRAAISRARISKVATSRAHRCRRHLRHQAAAARSSARRRQPRPA